MATLRAPTDTATQLLNLQRLDTMVESSPRRRRTARWSR